jgi:hypothetical protein
VTHAKNWQGHRRQNIAAQNAFTADKVRLQSARTLITGEDSLTGDEKGDGNRSDAPCSNGRPYGSEPWSQHVFALLGLAFILRPRGRPRKTIPEPENDSRPLCSLASVFSTIAPNRNTPLIRLRDMTRRYLADDAKRSPQRVIESFAVVDA